MALLTGRGLRITRYCFMVDLPYFKMAAIRHLGFLKLEILTSGPVWRHNMRHPAIFRKDRLNRSGDIADFRFSRWRPSAILDFQKLKILTSCSVRKPNMRQHKILRRSVKPFRRYGRFSIFKMAAVRHLGCSKIANCYLRSCSEAEYAYSCQITRRSVEPFRIYGQFSIFKDGGRPPAVLRVLGPPTKSIWWYLWLCKIWL